MQLIFFRMHLTWLNNIASFTINSLFAKLTLNISKFIFGLNRSSLSSLIIVNRLSISTPKP